MPESHLTTATFFEQGEEARAAGAEAEAQVATHPEASALGAWAQASSWISVVVAGAVIACVTVLAIPYLTAARSQKATHPIDWFLWFGGARSDQTFEKYLRDSSEAYRREWEESYRKSPAFQLDRDYTNWQFEPIPPIE
jgi:hypothetical protein